jgi:quercetin dioxygenase-like cupin family protein
MDNQVVYYPSMPIIQPSPMPSHEMDATRFWQLASPSTGSTEASVWRLEVSPGSEPVPHAMTREEILVVLEGTARASIDGAVEDVPAGSAIVVPADATFALGAAGSEAVVALAYLPVGGQAKIGDEEPFTPPWAQ